MASLQQLLGQSVQQNLGLTDLLNQRRQQARVGAQTLAQAGQVEVGAEFQRQALAEQARKEREAKEQKGRAGLFGTIGQVLGAAGAVAIGGPVGLGAALETAQVGATLGQAAGRLVSGVPDQPLSAPEQLVTQGLELGAGFVRKAEARDILKREAETKQIEAATKAFQAQIEAGKAAAELTPTQKAALDFQKANKGTLVTEFTDQQIKNLPPNAFVKIGLGDDAISFVKTPKQLSPEASAKLSGAQEGRIGINNLLNDLKAGDISANDFRKAVIPGAKKIPRIQTIASALDFNKEILARIFSGAAVPETEQKRFQTIFSVNKLDTAEVIQQKLQRNINMINRIENSVKFGAAITDGILDASTATQMLNEELKEGKKKRKDTLESFTDFLGGL